MKQVILSLVLFVGINSYAQQSFETIYFEGETREYYKYLPENFDQTTEEVPLVIFLHGLGGNALQLTGAGYNLIADTARFIPVYLEGTPNFIGDNSWNNGTLLGSEVNDVLFISRIIDSMHAEHNIDLSRVYMSGISMGSIMTYKAIRHLDNRIAAVSCHIGTMSTEEISGYNPTFPVPVQHLHGINDAIVPYNSGALPSLSLVPETIYKLKIINGWDGDSTIVDIPNTKEDSTTIQKIIYSCTTPLELWKMNGNGAGHIYLGPDNDTIGAYVSWYWFNQFSHPNPIPLNVNENPEINGVQFFPNPANNEIFIKRYHTLASIQIYDINGKLVLSENNLDEKLNVGLLKPGVYIIESKTWEGISKKEKLIIK
jgi:polyhydroxybutyrate depolymerase